MSSSSNTLTLIQSKCPQCGDEPHEPGQSKTSNCGESEVVHRSEWYVGGADSQLPSRYVHGSFYTRRGLVRHEFK